MFLLEVQGPDDLRVVVDVDERVGYAYLVEDSNIVADVWLFNVGDAPVDAEWSDPARAPFANPAAYVKHEAPPSNLSSAAVECRWRDKDASVDVVIDDKIYGRLWRGAKPGQARLAARPGPLATPLADG